MIGVSQNQNVRATLKSWAVSRKNTCKLPKIQPSPTASNPIEKTNTGSSSTNGLR